MRAVLVFGVIACVACCVACNDRSGPEWGGYGPQDPDGGGLCRDDGDCDGGDVCAHTGQCYPASSLRSVTAKWTIGGEKPTATSCTELTLVLTFAAELSGYGETSISYSPVACAQGQFFIDHMPMVFDQVRLQVFGKQHGASAASVNDATGTAQMDLILM